MQVKNISLIKIIPKILKNNPAHNAIKLTVLFQHILKERSWIVYNLFGLCFNILKVAPVDHNEISFNIINV